VLRAAFSYGVLTDCEREFAKQSQFVPGIMGANPYLERDYVNLTAGRADENKANQSQLNLALF
jgi:hypothetical protein